MWLGYKFVYFFFFKQKTAYEMRISDWSSDVCSSDLQGIRRSFGARLLREIRGDGHTETQMPISQPHNRSMKVYCQRHPPGPGDGRLARFSADSRPWSRLVSRARPRRPGHSGGGS